MLSCNANAPIPITYQYQIGDIICDSKHCFTTNSIRVLDQIRTSIQGKNYLGASKGAQRNVPSRTDLSAAYDFRTLLPEPRSQNARARNNKPLSIQGSQRIPPPAPSTPCPRSQHLHLHARSHASQIRSQNIPKPAQARRTIKPVKHNMPLPCPCTA